MTSTAMGLRRRTCVVLCLVVGLATLLAPLAAQTPTEIEEALKGLSWRSIGPAEMGGRTVDIAGIPGDPTTVYMATGSGGLWKTLDGGTTWKSIFESGNTLSLGAVEIAPSDHNVVYLGTGEHNPRNSACPLGTACIGRPIAAIPGPTLASTIRSASVVFGCIR